MSFGGSCLTGQTSRLKSSRTRVKVLRSQKQTQKSAASAQSHSIVKSPLMALFSSLLNCGPACVALLVAPLLLYLLLVLQNRRPSRFPRGPFVLPLVGPIGEPLEPLVSLSLPAHRSPFTLSKQVAVVSSRRTTTCSTLYTCNLLLGPGPRRAAAAGGHGARTGRCAADVPTDDGHGARVRRQVRRRLVRRTRCCAQLTGAAARSAHREGRGAARTHPVRQHASRQPAQTRYRTNISACDALLVR